MSRFLPLLVFVIWMAGPAAAPVGGITPLVGCGIFLAFYAVVILALAIWSRHVARASHFSHIQRRLRRFNLVIYGVRILIPAWLAAGVFLLGWKGLVVGLLNKTPLGSLPIDLPGLIPGCLPSCIAWMGLWWAQFPADRALREQNILIQLNESLPVQTPPSFRTYFLVNLRLQLLFTIAPTMLLLLLRDSLSLVLPPIFNRISFLANHQEVADALITLPALAIFLVFSPEILRRVLHTEPLPDCPLRRRLVQIAGRHGVGFRDVLLWKTENQMGNAAVMGFLPRFRYVLLSDLLLETMHDEQIEAIFAHELGHVTHRHLYWLMAVVAALSFVLAGPGQMAADALSSLQRHYAWLADSVQLSLMLGAAIGLFALVFGYISRKFERQADVFAARTIQEVSAEIPEPSIANLLAESFDITLSSPSVSSFVAVAPTAVSPCDHVGPHGAAVFCSALERVAAVNNIPIAARSWCHGSIAKRMRFLEFLSRDSARTAQYDRFMRMLYFMLAASLLIFGIWTMLVIRSA